MIRKTELTITELDKLLLYVNIQCVYMHIAEQKDKWECSSHIHNHLEIGYIYYGYGLYNIDGTDYNAEKGDIFVIPPKVPHYEVHDTNCPFQIIFLMLKFHGADDDWLSGILSNMQGKIHMPQDKKVRGIYDEIVAEIITQDPGYLSSIDAKLKSLFILMYRYSFLSDSETMNLSKRLSSTERNKMVIEKIQQFLLKTTNRKCSVNSISQQFFYNPKYLSSIFKKETGQSLSDFIQTARIEKARELLVQLDSSTEAIAEMLGFSSVHHFYKSFKKLTGKTPASYRSEYLDAPRDPFPVSTDRDSLS